MNKKDKNVEVEEHWYCPLIKGRCKKSVCIFYLKPFGRCSLTR